MKKLISLVLFRRADDLSCAGRPPQCAMWAVRLPSPPRRAGFTGLGFPLTAALLAGLIGAVGLPAQENNQPGLSADDAWKKLEERQPPAIARLSPQSGDASAAERQQKRDELVAYFGAVADEAKAFQEQHSNHGKATDARLVEAKNRLNAVLLGSGPQAGRARQLAKAVREDRSIPAGRRFEIALLEEFVATKDPKQKTRAAWLEKRTASARRLVAEFPEVPGAYDELLRAAMSHSGKQAAELANEVLAAPASETTKELARDLIRRETLAWKTLASVIGGVAGGEALLNSTEGRRVIFYTWRPENETDIPRIKAACANLPAGTMVLGVNLSRDVAKALAVASTSGLPGTQLYNGQASGSPVARQLALTRAGLMYAVRRDGTILNLSGEADPAATLAGLQ